MHIVMDAESIKRLNEGTATPPEGETSPVYGAELMESIVNAAESRKCGTKSRLKATTGSASSARCGGRGEGGGGCLVAASSQDVGAGRPGLQDV